MRILQTLAIIQHLLFKLFIQAWPISRLLGSQLTFIKTKIPFMYKVKCSLMFLVGNNNVGALQDYPIFHCQLFPEGPIGLNLTWNSLMVLGHHLMIVSLSKASSSSSWVAILISCKLSLLALIWPVIWWIWSFGSLSVSFWQPKLEKTICKLVCNTRNVSYCKVGKQTYWSVSTVILELIGVNS